VITQASVTYFEDLSDYVYHPAGCRPGTRTVGWLEPGHEFDKMLPTNELLDAIWEHCKVSVVQMRGIHECQFCVPTKTVLASRKDGLRRLLGTSEIRVFSADGDIYAAPSLVYHYVHTHHYKPPDEFIRALCEGPRPPSQGWLGQITRLGLQWNETLFRENPSGAFKWAKIDGEIRRAPVEKPVYFDES
jgi:hypothetical protein